MASRHFRLALGKLPFRFLADQLAQDSDFLGDARRILALDEDAYLLLATQLAKSDSFLGRSELTTIVVNSLGESEDSKRIANSISRIGEIVHEADFGFSDAMDALGDAIEEKAEGLEKQERQTLIDRLRKLAAEPIGIAKHFKAQQLVDVVGAELNDFRIVCDIRPIFDQQRERIDGAIPLSILRLEYTKPDGDTDVVELRVTENQIADFGEKIADAKLKIKMIKELLVSQDLRVPLTKSTTAED